MNGPGSESSRLATALADLPHALREAADLPMPDLRKLGLTTRRFLCSGLGSSSAHARFLAAQLSTGGFAAQTLSLGGESASPGDTLVVFSQGLSAPVRRHLGAVAPGIDIVLITSVDPEVPASGSVERREWLRAAEGAGLYRVPMMGTMEYGSLVRITGPITGYLTALRLANALGRPSALRLEEVVDEVVSCLDPKREVPGAEVFDHEYSLLATGICSDCLENLSLKVQEGLLAPAPPILSVDQVAHGPFQEAYPRPRHWIAFTRPEAAEEAESLRRLRQMIPAHQTVLELPAAMEFPWSIFAHEVLWTRAVLERREAHCMATDPWPGQGKDGPLYDWGVTAPAPAPRQTTMPRLEDWTSPELEARLAEKPATVVVPLGSTEQHGPHLPLGTDTRIAGALAERLSRRLPHALVLPALAFGIASEHQSFAGTIAIAEETFMAFLSDVLRSLARHEPSEILLFSAHGGNDAFLRKHHDLLAEASAPAQFLLASVPDRITESLCSLAAESGVSEGEAGWHAGELETSMMLGLQPASVRTDQLRPGHVDLDLPADELFYPDLAERVPSGVVGDPRQATALRAEAYLSRWVEELLKFYRSRASVHQTKGTKKA